MRVRFFVFISIVSDGREALMFTDGHCKRLFYYYYLIFFFLFRERRLLAMTWQMPATRGGGRETTRTHLRAGIVYCI